MVLVAEIPRFPFWLQFLNTTTGCRWNRQFCRSCRFYQKSPETALYIAYSRKSIFWSSWLWLIFCIFLILAKGRSEHVGLKITAIVDSLDMWEQADVSKERENRWKTDQHFFLCCHAEGKSSNPKVKGKTNSDENKSQQRAPEVAFHHPHAKNTDLRCLKPCPLAPRWVGGRLLSGCDQKCSLSLCANLLLISGLHFNRWLSFFLFGKPTGTQKLA